MNPFNRKFYTIALILCIFIISLAKIENTILGPSIAQTGYNFTGSVDQSGEIPNGFGQYTAPFDASSEGSSAPAFPLGPGQASGETSQGTSGESNQYLSEGSSAAAFLLGLGPTSRETSQGTSGESNQQSRTGSGLSIGQISRGNTEQSIQPSPTNTSLNSMDENTSLQLWIQEPTGKSQYGTYPIGAAFQLLASTPTSGVAELYEILLQSETVRSKKYGLVAGYNSIVLRPDQSGRHVLLFIIDDRPSSAVIVDVMEPDIRKGGNVGGIPAATPLD